MADNALQKAALAGVSSLAAAKVCNAMNQDGAFTRAAVAGALQVAATNFTGMNYGTAGVAEFLVAAGVHYGADMTSSMIAARRGHSAVRSRSVSEEYGCV